MKGGVGRELELSAPLPDTRRSASRPAGEAGVRRWSTEREKMSQHIILRGDSVIDNAAYVGTGESVVDPLQRALGDEVAVPLTSRYIVLAGNSRMFSET